MPPLYEEVSSGRLVPGPRRVSFTGRVVSICDHSVESKMPQAAKGCLKILVKGDRAVVLVSTSAPIVREGFVGCCLSRSNSGMQIPTNSA
jgi:hypothetical protein